MPTYAATQMSVDEAGVFTVSVEMVEALPPEETVRLQHQLESLARLAARRYTQHVATWGLQKKALHKLTAEEAAVLGLTRNWEAAREKTAWGHGLTDRKVGRPVKARP